MQRNYKLLKENYERLITINKNIQDQANDKEYAQEILGSELRTNYESVKSENIKLKDSLETQHKLWKVWLEKMDNEKNKPEAVKPDKGDEHVEEVVVEEEVVEVINDDEEVEDVDCEEIYQQFMKNKERGFKRVSPTSNSVPNKSTESKCEKCDYTATNKSTLNDHNIRVHKITR